MFKNPILVQTSANITIPIINNFSFAKEVFILPLGSSDIKEACKHYPIFFMMEKDGSVVPVALLGLDGENLFIDEKGNYKENSYIPAVIRAYPFSITQVENSYSLVIDQDAINSYPAGKEFFENTKPTPQAKEIISFVEAVYADLNQTKKVLALLAKKSLLKPMDIEVKVGNKTYRLQKMLIANKEAIDVLKDKDIAKLYRDGVLDIVTLHLASLSNLEKLGRMSGA